MFHLRHDEKIKNLLGDGVILDGVPTGDLNNVKGVADIKFGIKGANGSAGVEFKGKKDPGGSDTWEYERFVVSGKEGELKM